MRANPRLSPTTVLLAAGVAASLTGAASAEDRNWNNASGGSYTTITNWLEFTVPGITDIANFPLVPTYAVTFPANQTNGGVSVTAGFPTFNLGGRTLDVNGILSVGAIAGSSRLGIMGGAVTPNSATIGGGANAEAQVDVPAGAALTVGASPTTGALTVGGSGNGSLVINGGVVSCVDGVVAQAPTSVSSLTMSGAGSLTANVLFVLGASGAATAMIEGASVLSAPSVTIASANSSTGDAVVTGTSSRLQVGGELVVGDSGDASLTIEQGGDAISGLGSVGVEPASDSVASIDGTGAMWNMSEALQVGLRGKGALTVTNGGDAISGAAGFIGVYDGSDGAATLTGIGSSLSLNGQLQVGREGKGRLTIQGGAIVSSSAVGSSSGTAGIIGLQNEGDGAVVVSGFTSAWTNAGGALVVGWGSLGSLEIIGGASATCVSGFVGRNLGSIGTVRIHGAQSRWTMSGSARIGVDPNGANGGSGSVAVLAGGELQAADVTVGSFSTLLGDGTVDTTTVTNRGTVAPGETATGTLTIDGAYTQQPQGRLLIDIGPGGADKLAVTGSAITNGQLSVTTPPGFAPANGTVYTILTAASRSGTFSSIITTPMPGGRSFSIGYNSGSVVLTVVVGPGCPGDANGDNVVDFFDLNIVLGSFGQMGAGVPGDLNADGRVDFLDLNIVLSAYGTNC